MFQLVSVTRFTRKAKVLAVDDLPANLIALEAVLEGEFDLTYANSGAEAIEILKKEHDFSVILMDLQMPAMDGYETASRIKHLEGCEDIPIVFITAIYKEDPFVKRGYAVGGVDYFSKPYDPEILRRKVAIYASFRQKAALLKERERQVHESEELLKAGRKLSSVLEGLPVGVLISDTEGRICQTNDEVARICNAIEPMERGSYGEVLGWWDASGEMIRGKDSPLSRVFETGIASHNQPMQIRCVDGSMKTILGSASPLFGLDGAIVGAVLIIQDVSTTKQIEADFEERITRIIALGVELEQSTSH